MAEQKLSFLNTLTITKSDGTPFPGSISEEEISKILKREVPLISAGFITPGKASDALDGTYRYTIPLKSVAGDSSDAKAAKKLAAEVLLLHLNKDMSFKYQTDKFDERLFSQAGKLKGEVVGSQLSGAMRIESALYYTSLTAHLKAEKDVVNGMTVRADSDVLHSDRTAKMASLIEDDLNLIRFLHDKFTNGIPNDNIVGFLKPSVFKKLKYGIQGQGHVIDQIQTDKEVSQISLNGMQMYEEPLLGVKHDAGDVHETLAFDFSKLSAVFLVRGSTYHVAGNFYISEDKVPGTRKFIQLTTWISGTAHAKAYTARNRAVITSAL